MKLFILLALLTTGMSFAETTDEKRIDDFITAVEQDITVCSEYKSLAQLAQQHRIPFQVANQICTKKGRAILFQRAYRPGIDANASITELKSNGGPWFCWSDTLSVNGKATSKSGYLKFVIQGNRVEDSDGFTYDWANGLEFVGVRFENDKTRTIRMGYICESEIDTADCNQAKSISKNLIVEEAVEEVVKNEGPINKIPELSAEETVQVQTYLTRPLGHYHSSHYHSKSKTIVINYLKCVGVSLITN